MYTFDQLKEDVRKEAEALKVHATKEELGRLDFESLDPSHADHCVYGQMCGECWSDRAIGLIHLCTEKFLTDSILRCADEAEQYEKYHTYSPIEAYLMQPSARNANLIAYLKGESETLEL